MGYIDVGPGPVYVLHTQLSKLTPKFIQKDLPDREEEEIILYSKKE